MISILCTATHGTNAVANSSSSSLAQELGRGLRASARGTAGGERGGKGRPRLASDPRPMGRWTDLLTGYRPFPLASPIVARGLRHLLASMLRYSGGLLWPSIVADEHWRLRGPLVRPISGLDLGPRTASSPAMDKLKLLSVQRLISSYVGVRHNCS